MAKLIEYDISGVEESGGGTGVKATPGLYVGEVKIFDPRDKKADGSPANDIKIAVDVGPEYDWLFTHVGLGPESDWKLAEVLRALGLKEKGKLNPTQQVGKIVRVKVNPGEYLGEYSPQLGKFYKANDGDKVGRASEVSQNGASPVATETPDAAPEADGFWREGEPDPENPEEVVGSYDDWEDGDLEAEVEDRGLALPGGRGGKRDKMIKALRADDEVWRSGDDEPEAGDEPEDEAETAGDAEDDYETWDVEALKQEWEDREMGGLPAVRGRNAEDRLKAKIVEALRKDDAENPFEG